MWDKSPKRTLEYIAKAAEGLCQQWSDKLVFSVGSELTLFMNGIVEGRNFQARIANKNLKSNVITGAHNEPLNTFLKKASTAVRDLFHGKVTYASLIWEAVDWSLFDFVGVDHYRITRIEDKFIELLKPSFSHGKLVVITEFGYGTCHGGPGSEGLLSSAGLGGDIIYHKSQFLHRVPLLGRFVRPHLNGEQSGTKVGRRVN